MGHKGTFVEELRLLSSGGRCEGSPPTCLGPPGACGAPAPSPGRPAAAQAPHAAAHRQAVGLEGRLDGVLRRQPKCPGLESGGGERRRTPPSLRGGVSLKLGAAEGVGGCGRHPWAPAQEAWASTRWAGGIREELGSGSATVCLVSFIFPSATGTHLGRQPPVPVLCAHRCSAPTGALHPPVLCTHRCAAAASPRAAACLTALQ